MKQIYLIFFGLLLGFPNLNLVQAQNGPGGIGNADGTEGQPQVLFWLNADSLNYTEGANVDLWDDISGNANNFSQSTTSGQPSFVSDAINGKPAVYFDGTDMSLVDENGGDYINGLDAFTFFAVIESDETSTDAGFFDTEDPDGNDDLLAIRYDQDGWSGGGSDVLKAGINTTSGNVQIESSSNLQTTSSQLLSLTWSSGNSLELFVDGNNDALTDDGGPLNGTLTDHAKALIGKGPKDGYSSWKGRIAEVFFFGSELNEPARVIVENYISTKYEIAIPDDYFAGGESAFVHNLSGIGKEGDDQHNMGASAGMKIYEDGAFDSGDYVLFAHNNVDNDEASINTSSEVTVSNAEAAWNREWYVDKTGNLNTTFSFNIPKGFENGEYPHEADDYVLLYRSTVSSDYSIVSTSSQLDGKSVLFDVADSDLNDGYYTLGTLDQTENPVQGKPGKIWYTLVSGDWEDWETWTLDPSGALPDNPDKLTPEDSPTDKVVILNGRTVNVDSDDLENASLEVNGRLDLAKTSGHQFGQISGNGKILLQGDNFPSGDASDFTSKDKGTVEFYGTGAELSSMRNFNDVVVNLTDATEKLILKADYNIVGDLKINKGNFQINDDSNENPLLLDVAGDVTVAGNNNASVTVGTADAFDATLQEGYGNYHKGYHVFRVGGSFINNGTVRLTNQSVPHYKQRTTNGAVSLVFYGATNENLDCYNTTDLYNLVIDKGNDRTYELEIYADDKAYFALFGKNEGGYDDSDAAHPEHFKALWIANGTLRLKGSLYIPSLTEGTRDFSIGERAGLVLDGSDVFVQNTAVDDSDFSGLSHGKPDGIDDGNSWQALYPYGKLHVVDGHWYLGNGEAINFRDEAPGIIQVDGGILEANQIAISSGASVGEFSFILNGGEVHLTNEYGSDGSRSLLNLDNENMVFSMSGGAIYVDDANGHNPNGIHISSGEGNYNVTGGTVYINSGKNTQVRSTAPFHDLLVSSSSTLTLQEPLELLGDLEIQSGSLLDSDGYDVMIGGDFDLHDGAQYSSHDNTTHFNGNNNSVIYVRNTENEHELTFNHLVLHKEQRYNPSLFYGLKVISSGRGSHEKPVLIEGDLTVTRGEFDIDDWLVDLYGDLEIVDGRIKLADDETGRMVLSGNSVQTIKGDRNKNQSFGHLELNNDNGTDNVGATLLSDVDVNEFTLTNGVMDLDTYNLSIGESLNGTGFGASKMFKTAGNASDGGLTRFVDLSTGTGGTEILFPFGTGTDYNPATVVQTETIEDNGELTLKPVNNYHPATDDENKTIPYYWMADTASFSSLDKGQLSYTFTYNSGNFGNNINKGANFWVEDYQWRSYDGIVNGDDLVFPSDAPLSRDFTLGNQSAFKDPKIFYTRKISNGDQNWDDQDAWSYEYTQGPSANNDYPGKNGRTTDIVIIGAHDSDNHGYSQENVRLRANINTTVSELVFEEAEEGEGRGRLFPQAGTNHDWQKVSGNGEIQLFFTNSDDIPTFNPTNDFGDFLNNEYSTWNLAHEGGSGPSNAVEMPSFPSSFPNLRVTAAGGGNGGTDGWGNQHIVYFPDDIKVNGDLQIANRGALWIRSDIDVEKSVYVGFGYGHGRLRFDNSSDEHILSVGDDVVVGNTTNGDIDNSYLDVLPGGANAAKHQLILGGGIHLHDNGNGTGGHLDLYTTENDNNVVLELVDDQDHVFENEFSGVPDLYRIVMNKMADTRFTFQDAFSLHGSTNGDEKALELIGGDLRLEDSDIDITLSSGGADFRIPGDAELGTKHGAKVRVNGDNTGIWLDGRINVGYNSEWHINGGVNNYIEYSASGNAHIDVFQGELYVGSQIRRNTSTEEGVLQFSQNHENSIIEIGTNADEGGENSRGVFELVNNGSSFSQVENARMTIVNGLPNASRPSFYLDLDESEVSLGNGSVIAFGGTDTGEDQNMGLHSSVELVDVEIDNVSGNSPNVDLNVVPLFLENLSIDSGSSLNANGLNVQIDGNFTNDGTYNPNRNETIFSGEKDQVISGNTGFYDLDKQGSNDLQLDPSGADININNDLYFEAGLLIDNGNAIQIRGDAYFDGTHQHGGSGKGFAMDGNTSQNLSGNGTFGKLTIDNTSGVNVPEGNDFTISEVLRMENGIFDIDKNLLVLEENCQIEEVSSEGNFSGAKMIQTNISFTDNGVKKILPQGNSYFVFPMGSRGKFTPVTFDVTNNDASGGSIIIKPADEAHTSVSDNNNVLQYHWVLISEGLSGLDATARMKYLKEDVAVESPNTVEDYITARLLSEESGEWNKFSEEDVDTEAQELIFYFSGAGDGGITGDYTAGLDDAIPDQVPGYVSVKNGSWNDKSTWDTYPEEGGYVPDGGPRGAMVYIDHEVSVTDNYISSYRTTIKENGLLNLGATFGHRLGDVIGKGILQLERGNLPAGVYEDFLLEGTFEYTGNDDYDVLSNFGTVNNLIFSGSGERRMPNIDLTVNGYILLDGANLINEHNKTLNLEGDFKFNSGDFYAGSGTDALVIFSGNSSQYITGAKGFGDDDAFYNLNVNNSAGVVIETDVEVSNDLHLTDGIVNNSFGNRFAVINSSNDAVNGGGAASYVVGPFEKRVNNGGSFEFPVGASGRYGQLVVSGTQTGSASPWEISYHDDNPSTAGLDPDSYENPIEFVSQNEYWNVKGPDGSDAHVTIRWDDDSGVSSDETEREDLRSVTWDSGVSAWIKAGSDIIDNGQNSGTIKTDARQSFNEFSGEGNYFTLGSEQVYNYSWYGDTEDWFDSSNWDDGKVPSMSTDVDIPENPTGGNHPVINGDAFCRTLDLESNATVTLQAGSSLEIGDDIDNSGSMIIKSTNDNLSSLMLPENPTNSGDVNAQLELEADGKWYLGSPLKDETEGKPKVEWFYPDNDPNNDYVYVLRDLNDNGRGEWIRVDENGIDGDPYLYDLEFVAANYKNQKTLDLTGNVYDEEVTRTISGKPGYTLVGNPYLSAIDWGELDGWGRDGFTETMYSLVTVEQDGEEERVLQTVNSNGIYTIKPDGYDDSEVTHIAPFQAVWVKKDIEEAVDFTIKPQARVKNTGIPLKSSSSGDKESYDMIRIHSHNEQSLDGAVLYFSDRFNSGKGREDSEKKFNSSKNVPEIYTRIDSEAISINGQPALGEDKYEYPLSVRNRLEGEVTLSVDLEQFNYDYDVVLEDKEEGTYTNLRDVNEYSYTPVEMGKDHDRFVLHLEKIQQVPTDVEDIADDKADDISITRSGDYALISIDPALLQNGNADIELLDINGRLIQRLESGERNTRVKLPEESGIYFVRVNAGGQTETGKIVR